MHFVHSMWVKPLYSTYNLKNDSYYNNNTANKKDTYIVCNATSVAWINHLGGKINLYTDKDGLELLDFLPYDNIYDIEIPSFMPVFMFACCKMFALKLMPLGDVHIDGDVFLKSDFLINECSNDSYDLVILHIENGNSTINDFYLPTLNAFKLYGLKTLSCSLEKTFAYNCGTVGFFNNELKETYLNEYFSTLNNLIENKELVSYINENLGIVNKNGIEKCTSPDLILEQKFLYELSKKYNVNSLLGDQRSMNFFKEFLKYEHISCEFKSDSVKQILNQLKFLDIDLYNNTLKRINN